MAISTISPAYGRDYKNKKQIEADFNAEKDFIIEDYGHPYSGRYVNKQQMLDQKTVGVRYGKMRKYVTIKIKE